MVVSLKVGILFSGGKDSTYAAYLAKKTEEVCCLITLQPLRDDSYMFHYPNIRWTALQAQAMGLPQVMAETEGVKEVELDALKEAMGRAKREYGIEGIYSGALASNYQKTRVDKQAKELGLGSFSPLWGRSADVHLRNLIRDSFEVIITGVASLGLDQTWLGRKLDEGMVEQLLSLQGKYGLNATLEGGEGETFVLDCPIFDRRVEITSMEKHWDGTAGRLEIKEARLVSKGETKLRGAEV